MPSITSGPRYYLVWILCVKWWWVQQPLPRSQIFNLIFSSAKGPLLCIFASLIYLLVSLLFSAYRFKWKKLWISVGKSLWNTYDHSCSIYGGASSSSPSRYGLCYGAQVRFGRLWDLGISISSSVLSDTALIWFSLLWSDSSDFFVWGSALACCYFFIFRLIFFFCCLVSPSFAFSVTGLLLKSESTSTLRTFLFIVLIWPRLTISCSSFSVKFTITFSGLRSVCITRHWRCR